MLYSENMKKTKHALHSVAENGVTQETSKKITFRESVFWRKLSELLKPQTLRPLSLVLMFFFFQNTSGFTAIRPYMVELFQELRLLLDAKWITVSTADTLTTK
jgi:hypothetical protein